MDQLGIQLRQVLRLREGPPFDVGVSGLGHEDGGDVRLPPLQPKPGAQFVGQRLVLKHARLPGVPDRLLVEVQRGEVPASDALDLRREQQRLAEKVFRAALRQDLKRLLRLCHLLAIRPSLLVRGVGVIRGQRETVPEIELDRPDRPRQMIHDLACDPGRCARLSVIAEHVTEL